MAICKHCGAPFEPKRWNQTFCSSHCKWTSNNQSRTLKPNVFYDCQVCGKKVAKYIPPSDQQSGRNAFQFCSQQCAGKSRRGDGHHMWKGGRQVEQDGYVKLYMPEHPHANKKGQVWEHRYVMEQHIGRLLTSEEVVHHINDNPSDNRIENLQLFPSQAEHKRHHEAMRQRDDKGHYLKRSI